MFKKQNNCNCVSLYFKIINYDFIYLYTIYIVNYDTKIKIINFIFIKYVFIFSFAYIK